MRRSLAALVVAFGAWAVPLAAQGDGLDSLAVGLNDLLTRERFDSVVMHFDSTMTAQFPEAKLEALWTQIVTQAGPYEKRLGVRRDAVQRYRRVFVTAQFSGGVLDILWVFDAADRVAGLFVRPGKAPSDSVGANAAPYIDSARFEEVELTVGAPPWRLPATLTRPRATGPVPALVLVHGSGPNDRDETIGPNKPFRDLAQGLASQGIAVLRYEKRTRAYRDSLVASGGLARFTLAEETVDDAVAAVAAARGAKGIDPARVYVAGHSLGAMAAPRIAARDSVVAGIILLAAPSRPLQDLIVQQVGYLVGLDGDTTEAERARLTEIQNAVHRIEALTAADSADTALVFGAPASYWLDLQGYDPVATAGALHRPMLILSGGRDYQVTAEDDHRWRAALEGRDEITFLRYPTLNHLFIPGEGPPNPVEYDTPGHVAPTVIRDIAAWIRRASPRS